MAVLITLQIVFDIWVLWALLFHTHTLHSGRW